MNTNDFIKKLEEKHPGEYTVLGTYVNSKTKIKVKCNNCGKISYKIPNNLLYRVNSKCKCYKNLQNKISITHDDFIKKLEEKHPGEYTVLGTYVNSKTKIKVKCNNCGKILNQLPYNLYKNKKCTCYTIETYKEKYNTDWFKDKIKEKLGSNYKLLSNYVNTKTKVKMLHKVCNNIYLVKPNRIISNGTGCPYCNGGIKDSFKTFLDKFNKRPDSDEYEILTKEKEYINSETYIKIKHKKCGYINNVKATYLVRSNYSKCPKCSNILKLTQNEFISRVKNLTNDEYTVLGEYINNHTKIKLLHNKCNNNFEMRPSDFLKGQRCPICSRGKQSSKAELEILEFIKTFYNGKIIKNSNRIIKPYELDLYFPKLNIAIEFNGIYWHSEKKLKSKDNKNYHLNKLKLCQEKNITLIQIFEDEWEFKKDIVKSKIKHILGYNKNPKIYARKCYVKEINNKIKNDFLEKNHIQGKDISILNLGLYYNDILVSVMTFGDLRLSLGNKNKKEGTYELIRFANDIEFNVIGSFGKLFKYFDRNFEYNKIITYADMRWSKGNLYYKNNFILDHISKPSYSYVQVSKKRNTKKRYNRFSFRKQKLKELFPDIYSDDKTEKEIMEEAGYSRIYDCGNLVFIYNNPNT